MFRVSRRYMLIDCCDAQTFLAGVDKLAVITYSPTYEQGRLGGAGKCSCAYATGAHKHQATSLQVATHSPPLPEFKFPEGTTRWPARAGVGLLSFNQEATLRN